MLHNHASPARPEASLAGTRPQFPKGASGPQGSRYLGAGPDWNVALGVMVRFLGSDAMHDMKTTADRYRARADECLRKIKSAKTEESAQRYMDLAQTYSRLADWAEEHSSETKD